MRNAQARQRDGNNIRGVWGEDGRYSMSTYMYFSVGTRGRSAEIVPLGWTCLLNVSASEKSVAELFLFGNNHAHSLCLTLAFNARQ